MPDPVFIIGTERSGSNLVRLLLNAHPNIAIPHPPHVMRDMGPFVHLYGNLQDDTSFLRLVRDMKSIVKMHFAPWPFELKEENLFRDAPTRSLYGAYVALYEQYRNFKQKKRWGCKSTFMYRHIGEILETHAEPRLLHLVRDPRDVAVSAEQSIFSMFHPYKQAQLWAEQQGEIENWGYLREEGKLLRIRYEDLTQNPEAELKRIMAFLGESYLPQQLEYFKGREAGDLAKMSESWRNCNRPVSNKSVGRFRDQLSDEEIALVELATRDLMERYGYEPHCSVLPEHPGLWQQAKIELGDRKRMLAAESRAFIHDKNFGLRWKKWLYILYVRGARSI